MSATVLPFKQKVVVGEVKKLPRMLCVTCDSKRFEIDAEMNVFCSSCGGYIWHLKVINVK